MICPCQQQQSQAKAYGDCCQPYHLGKPPSNVEALMRSRYSGFVLGLTDYVKKTWHPDTCPTDLSLAPDAQWKKLDVIKTNDNQVHFKAYFQDEEGLFQCLEELSEFKKMNDQWVYVSGKVNMHSIALQRNDRCLCGSGKKYKKCCAQ